MFGITVGHRGVLVILFYGKYIGGKYVNICGVVCGADYFYVYIGCG
jgi:hypothetical protein